MKGWRLALSLLCWTVLAVFCGAAAQAAGFSSSLTVEEGGPGTVVEVAVSYDGTLGDVAAFQVAVAYILLTIGLKTTPPVTASLVSGIEPVLNPILVAVFYHEMVGPLALAGAAIVISGVVGYNVLRARQSTE